MALLVAATFVARLLLVVVAVAAVGVKLKSHRRSALVAAAMGVVTSLGEVIEEGEESRGGVRDGGMLCWSCW